MFVNPRTKRISRGHWRRKLGGASGLFCGSIVIERVRTLRLKLLTCVLRQILTLLSRGLGFLHWLTGSTSCHIVVFVVDFCQSSVIWLLCVISGKSIRLCRISLILIGGLLMLWMLGKWVAFSFLAQMELTLCSHDSVVLVVAIETRIWCHWFPFSFFPFLLTDNWYRHFVGMVDDYLSFLQEIDLRIGASFTRFQTMLMRDAFIIDTVTDDRNLVLSYGPCQVCLC